MSRFAASQSDLFAPPPAAKPPEQPSVDPIVELTAMLDYLKALDAMPWGTISAAMQEECRVLWLAKQAGPDGADLARAVGDEFERLLATTD